ncbi:MAG TPA: hypothetical protein VKQ28_05205 [Candidatus Acidoferrum sp.]|nr:hypothetical protein [Candidatus Acidoferrum sp.]
MKKLIVVYVVLAVVAFLFSGVAEAGVVRTGAKVVSATAKVVSHPVRHPVKDGKAVRDAVKKVVW